MGFRFDQAVQMGIFLQYGACVVISSCVIVLADSFLLGMLVLGLSLVTPSVILGCLWYNQHEPDTIQPFLVRKRKAY